MVREARSADRRRQNGSVTLMSLCLTTALGIALSSYLALCSRSALFSTRTLHQEKVQELALVGLEEALWSLNEDDWTGCGPAGTTDWSVSGADRTAVFSYTLPEAGASGQVTLTVTNYASTGPTWPEITSVARISLASGQTFSKTLRATTSPAPLFANAIASADSYVSFVAGGTVDSWNSDPDNNPATAMVPYSFTAGNPTNYSAVVAGRGNGTYGVMLTQATVRGYVATFGLPVSYSTSGSPAGSVVGPTTPAATKVDTARLGKSAFVPDSQVFSVEIPPTSGGGFGGLLGTVLDLVNTLLSAPTSQDVFKTGELRINGGLLALFNPNMTINRPIKLIVDGDLIIENVGRLTITATGSVEIFVTGDVTIGGNGIRNLTNDPRKVAIFSTSSSTTDAIQYNTTEAFCGVIYSENKPIDIRQNATFHGALFSRQFVRFSTSATAPVFHYDTSLRNVRFNHVKTPYLIEKVTEP